MSLVNAFHIIDDAVLKMVEMITNTINTTSLVNIDFADVSGVLKNTRMTMSGFLRIDSGEDKAMIVAIQDVTNPLLDYSIHNSILHSLMFLIQIY